MCLKKCVCTLHYKNSQRVYYNFLEKFAIPTIEMYSKRIGVDFHILNNDPVKYNGT